MLCFVQSLGAHLAETKDETKVTKNDILHSQNPALTKFKTLQQIRQGNTKNQIKMFETL